MTARPAMVAIACAMLAGVVHAQPAQAPPPSPLPPPQLSPPSPASQRITLEQAIAAALQHNHTLQAARTTIQQSEADEITANLRPNPGLSADLQGLPLSRPSQGGYFDGTQADVGLSYLFERGDKRARRLEAAKAATAVTRSQVADGERALSFQVASQFIAAELAESTLELARDNLKSFVQAVDIAEDRFRSGGMSENDYLKIKLQLLQFQTDVEQAQLARAQPWRISGSWWATMRSRRTTTCPQRSSTRR